MPISQTTGANSQPSIRCRVGGCAVDRRQQTSTALPRLTSATITISMAMILSSSGIASSVPRVTASMALPAC
jgi:hypothetical protein